MTDRRNETVLVTGATGFVGRTVVEYLKASGFPVRALSRNPETAGLDVPVQRQPTPDAPDEAFLHAVDGVTHIVHCAVQNNSEPGIADDTFFAANSQLTARIARAASGKSGRFVLISSLRAVVDGNFEGVITEATQPHPTGVYGRSKLAGEQAAREAYEAAGRSEDLTILRPTAIYGPDMRGALGSLLKLAGKPYPLPLRGVGGQRSFLSLSALADAVTFALTQPRLDAPVFMVADKTPITIEDALTAFRRGMGRRAMIFRAPQSLLSTAAATAGHGASWQAFASTQICDASRLVAAGWNAETDTCARLAELAKQSVTTR